MAATATAQSFNPQNAAADLRRSQRSALQNQQTLRDIPNITPANNNNFENSLSQESQFAAAEQRHRTLQATRRDVLPVQPDESADEEYQMEEQALEQAEQVIRAGSFNQDVLQLGPTRALRQQLADRAAKYAADKAKKKMEELTARLLVQGGDDVIEPIVDLTEGAVGEEDLGFFSWTDIAYDYARFAVTIFIPKQADVGNTAGDAAKYTATEAIHLVVPPFKFFSGDWNIIDVWDDIKAAFYIIVVPGTIITILGFFFICLCLIVYGVYSLGQTFSISGLASLLSASN